MRYSLLISVDLTVTVQRDLLPLLPAWTVLMFLGIPKQRLRNSHKGALHKVDVLKQLLHCIASVEEIIKVNIGVVEVTAFRVQNKITLRHFKPRQLFEVYHEKEKYPLRFSDILLL